MDYIDFLDRVLLFLSKKETYVITKDNVSEFSDEENRLLPQAVRKLEKDGYAYGIDVPSKSFFKISFEGNLALVNTPENFKNKPYAYKLHKEKKTERNNKIKNVAVVSNAIIALILSAAALFTSS